jgi:plastocyanin
VGERPVHSLVAEEGHAQEPPPKPGGSAKGAPVPLAAKAIAFSTSEISLPAGTPSVISFDNQDEGVPHNVAIYTSQGGDPLFQGEIVPGPAEVDYDVPPLEAGEYFFQCDVHPTMSGTVTVA